jgi:hypothetical protein
MHGAWRVGTRLRLLLLALLAGIAMVPPLLLLMGVLVVALMSKAGWHNSACRV